MVMKPGKLIPALLIAQLVGTTAQAGSIPSAARREEKCLVPLTQWQSRATLRARARERGWKIRRIKSEDGCYEIKGWDKTGRAFEALLHPKTLDPVRIEYDDDERDWLKKPKTDN